MCGIVGIFRPDGTKVNNEEISSMLDIISYRGPDGSGIYTDEDVGFGHVRLAIQDLSDLAKQPMVSHDKRFVITYNGEIYNIAELQQEIKTKGVSLKSTGDTETLLEYIALFGVEEALSRIEGMFAFGLWDSREKRMILARDRYGIKPLYYRIGSGGEVRFASEKKTLIEKYPEPDMCTLNAILLGLGGTWGDPTVFRDIKYICAGEWLAFKSNSDVKRKSYFHINDYVDEQLYNELGSYSKEDIVSRVADDLEKSVELRLISDAPVAVLVSGGVDSSIISAIANQRYRGLQLYHANVANDSETPAAEALAKSLKLELKSVKVNDQDVLENIADVTYHYEMPLLYQDGSSIPFYLVSKLVADDGVKVILTGEGSDEFFLGYPNIAIRPYVSRYRQILKYIQNIFHICPALGNILWPRNLNQSQNHLQKLMFRYELEERRGEAAKRFNFIKNKTELDWHVMAIDGVLGNVRTLMQRNDRMAMAWGLESRFPFLGYQLARTAVNMPNRYKVRKTLSLRDWRHPFISDKWVIREISEKYMPKRLAHRRKFGFRSRFYDRIKIDQSFFYNGFMSTYYGLNKRAVSYLFSTASPRWLGQILSLEVWGRIFPLGNHPDKVKEHVLKHVSVSR